MEYQPILHHIWPTLLIWSLLYIGDYYLTVYTARRITGEMAVHLEFERSFELNPLYEGDINQLRPISPRFILMWLVTSAFLYLAWGVTRAIARPGIFDFLTGELLLLELAVLLRHFRNLALIKAYRPGAMLGHLRYAYWFGLRLSAWELLGFSVFYLVLAVLLGSWFFGGGAVGSLLMAYQHWNRSRKDRRQSEQAGPS